MMRADLLSSPRKARRRLVLRPRKPLTNRELQTVFDRVKKRILQGGEPFGVFAMKQGTGRVFKLLGHSSPEFAVQLRVDQARQHLVSIYDAQANLGDVWDDGVSSFSVQ